jgi:hypothetical protein
MPQDDRKQVLFRCDPKLYAAFAEAMRKRSKKATVNVGAELVEYMQQVVGGSAGKEKESNKKLISIDADNSASYNLKTAKQKSMEAAKALTEALSAIEKAIGGDMDEFDPLAFIGDAADAAGDTVREAREVTEELKDDEGISPHGKHDRPRKTSGGEA